MTSYGAAEGSNDQTQAKFAEAAVASSSSSRPVEPKGWVNVDMQFCLESAAPYVAEFVGTALIVFTMGCCSFCGDPLWNPTALACIVTMAIFSFGSVSGAHLNPAVTLALCTCLKLPWKQMVPYMLSQAAGAFFGSLGYWAIFAPMKFPKKEQWDFIEVGVLESLYTFMLVFVFMNCRTSVRNNKEDDQNHFFALAIGFVYIAGGYAIQDISGCFLNPAASLAIGVTAGQPFPALIYGGWQMLGGWLGSVAFAAVRPEDFKLQYDGSIEDFVPRVRSKMFSELIGTFLVVMTVGLNVVTSSVAGPWSSAAAYISMIYSLGDVSGGHFNPAVTLAAVVTRRDICSITLGQTYVFNQLLGGVAAGIVYVHYRLDAKTGKQQFEALHPGEGYTLTQVAIAEVTFTALFCFVFLAVATTAMPPSITRTNFYFALSIGSCATIGGFAIGPISGGALNPAVALGVMVAHVRSLGLHILDSDQWVKLTNVLWYSLYELAGGAVGAFTYALTHQKEYLKSGMDLNVP